jgi:hypothetical protein
VADNCHGCMGLQFHGGRNCDGILQREYCDVASQRDELPERVTVPFCLSTASNWGPRESANAANKARPRGCAIATVSQPCLAILASMGIRPDDSKPAAARALQRRHTLLAAWLDALDQLDGPSHRRAAKLRQEQQLRQDSPIRRVPNRGPQLRALVHPTRRPRLGDRSRAAHSSTIGGAPAASGFSQTATPGTVAIPELD